MGVVDAMTNIGTGMMQIDPNFADGKKRRRTVVESFDLIWNDPPDYGAEHRRSAWSRSTARSGGSARAWATGRLPGHRTRQPHIANSLGGTITATVDTNTQLASDDLRGLSRRVAEEETVPVRLRVHGTHDGELMGMAATGRPIDIAVLDLFEVLDGLLRQFGVSQIRAFSSGRGQAPSPGRSDPSSR